MSEKIDQGNSKEPSGEKSTAKTPIQAVGSKPVPKRHDCFDFKELIHRESEQLAGPQDGSSQVPTDCVVSTPGPGDEPWLAYTNRDRLGLALSGGGMRSATFNLGLLQGLRQKRILDLVDYLSTLSGGGYVGGFWTAWRHRLKLA